jgi:DNA-binding MarR family transcriptional regulator
MATRAGRTGPTRGRASTARQGGDGTGVRRNEVGAVLNALRRLVRGLHRSSRITEQRWNVSAAQLLVLDRLAEKSALSVNELAERTFTHQSTVSVVAARLVRRGLVRREQDPDDARRTRLSLTASGRALRDRATSAASVQIVEALEEIPTNRLRVVHACLDRLVKAIGVESEPALMFFEESNGTRKKRSRGVALRTRA